MRINKLILILGIFILAMQLAIASEINVYREIPKEVALNQTFEIRILINSSYNEIKPVYITEMLSPFISTDNFDSIIAPNESDWVFPPFYSWSVNLTPNSINPIIYNLRADKIGTFELVPTEVNVENETYKSDNFFIKVLCNKNNICEPEQDENYFTCSEDCPSGSADGICDLINDKIHDPDCTNDTDPVEIIDICNNSVADFGYEDGLDCGGICMKSCNENESLRIWIDQNNFELNQMEVVILNTRIICNANCNNVQAELISGVQLSPEEGNWWSKFLGWFKMILGVTGKVILNPEIKDCGNLSDETCQLSWDVSENNPGTYSYYVQVTSTEQEVNSDLIGLVVLSPEENLLPSTGGDGGGSSGGGGGSSGGGSSTTSTQQNQTETETFVDKGTNMSQEEREEYVKKGMGVTIYVIAGLVIILISILVVLFIKSRKK